MEIGVDYHRSDAEKVEFILAGNILSGLEKNFFIAKRKAKNWLWN